MKRSIKTLIFVTCLLAALAVALLIINKMPNSDNKEAVSTDAKPNYKTFIDNFDQVKTVTIKNGKDEWSLDISLNSDGTKKYAVAGSDSDKYSTEKLSNLYDAVCELSYKEVIPESANLSEFGLQNKNVSIAVKYNYGLEKTIYKGNPTPFKDGYYVSINGSTGVYSVLEDAAVVFGAVKEDCLKDDVKAR